MAAQNQEIVIEESPDKNIKILEKEDSKFGNENYQTEQVGIQEGEKYISTPNETTKPNENEFIQLDNEN